MGLAAAKEVIDRRSRLGSRSSRHVSGRSTSQITGAILGKLPRTGAQADAPSAAAAGSMRPWRCGRCEDLGGPGCQVKRNPRVSGRSRWEKCGSELTLAESANRTAPVSRICGLDSVPRRVRGPKPVPCCYKNGAYLSRAPE